MSFKRFMKELNGNRIEGELIKTVFYSLVTSFIVIGALYIIFLKDIENFIPKYGFYLFLAAISYSLVLPTIRQVRTYKQFACMPGMMIGMTIGMIAGFMSGYLVGATNGMFVGGIFGILVGSAMGIWMGSCCGIMGVMEGIMAGFMGGLMGAMSAIMLLNDNLRIASIIFTAFLGIISVCLNYMIFFEMKENEEKTNESNFVTMFITFILIIITTWLIVFGPRSALFS